MDRAGDMGRPLPGRDEPLTARTVYRAIFLAFALVVVVLLFPVLAGLLLLLLLVVVVAVPMTKATDALRRIGVPRGVAAPLILVAIIAVVGGIIALLVPVFRTEGQKFVGSLPSLVDSVRRDFGRGSGSNPSTAGHDVQTYINGYTGHPQKLLGPATTIGAGLAGVITTLIVIAITSVYTAVRPEPLLRGVVRLAPPRHRPRAEHVLQRLGQAYMGWLKGLVAGMVVLWVATYIGLQAVNLPYAVVFATVTAVAMVVPYYGALVSSVPPILLALTISPGKALIVAVIYLTAHQIEGHIIEPLVMSRAVSLHPALVAVGVIAVERLFGPIGLIVAVPLLVTAKVLVEELWIRSIEEAQGGHEPPTGEDDARAPAPGERAGRFARSRGARSAG